MRRLKKTPVVTVDTYSGTRSTYIDLRLDIKSNDNVRGDKQGMESLVGLRTRWDLSKR